MILYSVVFLLSAVHVHMDLEPNMEYFVMTEAHISEYRSNENANSGYPPLYIACDTPVLKHSCEAAIHKIDDIEGYIYIHGSHYRKQIYYGCPQNKIPKDVLNPEEHYQKELVMRAAVATLHEINLEDQVERIVEYNQYKHWCVSEVLPALWRMGPIQGEKVHYGIGFLIRGLKNMPIVEVYYDRQKKIPIWTKHTLHGASLAAPISPFKSLEEIVYQEDLENFKEVDLQAAIGSYYLFNERNSVRKEKINDLLELHKMKKIPEESEIVMGHMIPEYDMITSNWQKVTRFAQTVVPTWKELYLNEWVDVEEIIREESFKSERRLAVYSGTHGQLTLNIPSDDNVQKPNFFLGLKRVAVPEMIWKLVIDDNSARKKAVVIIFHNLTKELENLKIFTKFTPPCNKICKRFKPKHTDETTKLIYCCTVNEVKNKIEELPIDDIKGDFDLLIT